MQSAIEPESQFLDLKQGRLDEKDHDEIDYTSWSRSQLISRLIELEQCQKKQQQQKFKNEKIIEPKIKLQSSLIDIEKSSKRLHGEKRSESRPFDPSKYNTRLVAFKLAYFGKRYSGFEYHAKTPTSLPTVEEELWKAFTKAKLIFPHPNQAVGDWGGCEYSKCGRTDSGVSAFGQVICLRVRSNRPLGSKSSEESFVKDKGEIKRDTEPYCYLENRPQKIEMPVIYSTLPRDSLVELAPEHPNTSRIQSNAIDFTRKEEDANFEQDVTYDPVADELPYVAILNRLLPLDIRFLAWCPAPPLNFSARFSCRERQYRYFFTQPCYMPLPNSIDPFLNSNSTTKDGYLDINAMNTAAKLFEGLHDFRNFCKVDASKQLESFVRRIYYAEIKEVPDTTSTLEILNSSDFQLPNHSLNSGSPKVYAFILHGSAFLWHQVRHMIAILFLIGQGLEEPSIITKLLDVTKNPRRPMYQMAAETPLVLWDCVFPHEEDTERREMLQWIYVGDTPGTADAKYGIPIGGLMNDLWQTWRERKIDEILSANLLGLIAGQGISLLNLKARSIGKGKSQKVFDGSERPKLQGKYTPLMMRPVMDTVDIINQRYAIRKGFESSADMKQQGFRRLNNPGPDHNAQSNLKE
ncbi:putative pseudouridylate synthase 3 [Erysiphe necator]|uniref:Putative pseudouridylate synthase 3 n=1 Tax=Uncinula necator TaxID=52586 RepID=A0A0B1P2E9_UNCNE|nr:putative pseudouridylate synthase 3 [Erysiphe necator]